MEATIKMVVLGAAGVAHDIVDLADALGIPITAFVDETGASTERTLLDSPIHDSIEPWVNDSSVAFALAIGDNAAREAVHHRLRGIISIDRFPPLIHPGASVSAHARVGQGSIVLAGCRIAARADIAQFGYFNFNSVVAHECRVGSFVSFGPGAIAAGRCSIGERSALGMNCCVREKTSVGSDVVIGANSFVNSDLPPLAVAVGSPARVLRSRRPGERYLR